MIGTRRISIIGGDWQASLLVPPGATRLVIVFGGLGAGTRSYQNLIKPLIASMWGEVAVLVMPLDRHDEGGEVTFVGPFREQLETVEQVILALANAMNRNGLRFAETVVISHSMGYFPAMMLAGSMDLDVLGTPVTLIALAPPISPTFADEFIQRWTNDGRAWYLNEFREVQTGFSNTGPTWLHRSDSTETELTPRYIAELKAADPQALLSRVCNYRPVYEHVLVVFGGKDKTCPPPSGNVLHSLVKIAVVPNADHNFSGCLKGLRDTVKWMLAAR